MSNQTTQTAPATELNRLGLAIVVKFLPCTNSRPARWKATIKRDRDCVFSAIGSFDYGSPDDGRRATADACLAKFNAWIKKDYPELSPNTLLSIGYLHPDTWVYFC